jgi:hypothetical protein
MKGDAKMSDFPDYEKAMKAFLADGADNATAAMKPVAEAQDKLSKIALAAAKDGIAESQSWTNAAMAALEPLTKPVTTPAELAAASTEFARSHMHAAPKHLAAFADIAKAAQMATLDVMLDAGRTGMGVAAARPEPTAKTDAPTTAASKAPVNPQATKKTRAKPKAANPAKADAKPTEN